MIILPRSFLLKISGWIWVLSFWEAECTDGYSPSVAELSCTASVLTPATFTCNPNACKLPRVQNQALSTSVIPCPPDPNRDKLKWYNWYNHFGSGRPHFEVCRVAEKHANLIQSCAGGERLSRKAWQHHRFWHYMPDTMCIWPCPQDVWKHFRVTQVWSAIVRFNDVWLNGRNADIVTLTPLWGYTPDIATLSCFAEILTPSTFLCALDELLPTPRYLI